MQKIKILALLYILFCIKLHKNHFSFFNLIYNFTCTVTTSTFGEGKSLNSVRDCTAPTNAWYSRAFSALLPSYYSAHQCLVYEHSICIPSVLLQRPPMPRMSEPFLHSFHLLFLMQENKYQFLFPIGKIGNVMGPPCV